MAIPSLVPTLLASAAGIAWFNAKTQFIHDIKLLSPYAAAKIKTSMLERRDQVNLFYTLENHAITGVTSNLPCLVYEGKTWSFKELYNIALQYGTWLKRAHGVAPKEIVAMDFMNKPEFIFLWLGIWSLGACPAFINYNLTGNPLLHCVKTSTSRILFVDEEIKPQITEEVIDALATPDFRNGKGPVTVIFFDATTEQQIQDTEAVREPNSSRAGAKGHELANLIYTSGTTGLPKPAVVSWNKAYIGGGMVSGYMGLKRTDRFYTCMPLYHTSASILGFCMCLMTGTTFVLGHKFSSRTFWPEVRDQNATVIQYVGETCRYLLAAPPLLDPINGEDLDTKNNVRMAFGNGLRPDIWNRFKQRFDIGIISEFYAATESPSALFNLSSNDFSCGAIGRSGLLASLLMGSQVAILQIDWEHERPLRSEAASNHCIKVKTGEPGELVYKVDPANISKQFQGYYDNSKATESKILRDVFTQGDAWYRTGDVLSWDADGRWWFCDRIGDTFRWKSENVSTMTVSEVLGTHPSVHEANVYGVEIPHHDGRAGCAAILLKGKADQELLDGLAMHTEANLPRYAVPLFLRVVSEIEATGSNKQQKHTLRLQGVEPGKIQQSRGDKMYWLKEGTYVEFGEKEWAEMSAGKVRL